jgi:hypothetical protein
VFVDEQGEQLNHEIEHYDAGTLVAWVRIPTLDLGVGATLFAYFGNGGGTGSVSGNVWDTNFHGVWHFVGGDSFADASTFGNDGTGNGGIGLTNFSEGMIGHAGAFDGIDDFVTIGTNPSLLFSNQLTVSAWIYAESFKVDSGVIVAKSVSHGSVSSDNVFFVRGADSYLTGAVRSSGEFTDLATGALSNTGTWHHVAMTYRDGNGALYFDGAEVATDSASSPIDPDDHPIHIGGWGLVDSDRLWHGRIDEVRISAVSRPAEWIAAEYDNQSEPGTFVQPGPVEVLGDCPG